MNQSLLLLSKIENEQFDGNSEVNVNALVKKLLEDFSGQIEFYNLKLSFLEKDQVRWIINVDLADILLSNLIKNAVKHTTEGGSIDIIVGDKKFIIENSGDTELNEEVIFNRFYKEASTSESTGLGLAIAKAVTAVSDLRVDYNYHGKHIFTIKPKA